MNAFARLAAKIISTVMVGVGLYCIFVIGMVLSPSFPYHFIEIGLLLFIAAEVDGIRRGDK